MFFLLARAGAGRPVPCWSPLSLSLPEHKGRLTGPPEAPSWMRTLTMSTGWMMQVAPIPDRPPLKNGLAAFQTELSEGCGLAGAAISNRVFFLVSKRG